MPPKGVTRDQRVTLALKYHYLDGLSAAEIRDRFEAEGIGEFARSTIRRYLNDSPKEEVLEQIEKEQATVREQIADRQERLWARAREAEFNAFEDEPIKRVRPKVNRYPHSGDGDYKPAWEDVEPGDDDWPEWADERDHIIRFTGEETFIHPGQLYPTQGLDGGPQYTTEFVGVETVKDERQRSFLRQEQASHLEKKGDALGVYEENINLSGDIGIESKQTLGDEEKDLARELIRQQQRKDSGSSDE